MKCCICGIQLEKHFLTGQGFACQDCADRLREERQARLHELEQEPLGVAPELMDVVAFDRWVLKLAVQTIQRLSPRERARTEKKHRILLVPEELSLLYKQLILQCMSASDYCCKELSGPDRWRAQGQFWFEKPVPFTNVRRAAFEAGLVFYTPTEERKTQS
jgi:hypothetical protein